MGLVGDFNQMWNQINRNSDITSNHGFYESNSGRCHLARRKISLPLFSDVRLNAVKGSNQHQYCRAWLWEMRVF